MIVICKFGGVDIPAVSSQQVSYDIIGDRARTAGGKLRQDVISVKREWRIQTRKMTKQEADELINLLLESLFGRQSFWLDEFGHETNTVSAYCDIEREERVPFGKDGQWHADGRRLTLRFIEQ